MKTQIATFEISIQFLESVDTLDELEYWLTAQHPRLMRELRATRREDIAGKFKRWKPRHLTSLTESK